MPSLKRHDGEMVIDHRFSPGLTQEQARSFGLPGARVGEGQMYEAPTLGCHHCGSCYMLNPDRTRAREYCRLCDHYICDMCHAVRCQPSYVHRTIKQLEEMVTSGKWQIIGGSVSSPLLIPTGD